ncbi:hypothetical protein P170DRAFT_479013 [Aspergillus steynii IBT 23096]|uniref:Uncharacterized protein n=1 Tax=Aspergillus steynii IBT 23096 TaxID=1392250 RepID=A0A2I2FZQ1_9EURO|nr:uncharacterized protein P170DRAFT_479013 [Aspergillus steynii IBT 23096]PLB46094.1 hypothetical protein P170DRAFT_479013 [Aspergillus steynii IBT 23096]
MRLERALWENDYDFPLFVIFEFQKPEEREKVITCLYNIASTLYYAANSERRRKEREFKSRRGRRRPASSFRSASRAISSSPSKKGRTSPPPCSPTPTGPTESVESAEPAAREPASEAAPVPSSTIEEEEPQAQAQSPSRPRDLEDISDYAVMVLRGVETDMTEFPLEAFLPERRGLRRLRQPKPSFAACLQVLKEDCAFDEKSEMLRELIAVSEDRMECIDIDQHSWPTFLKHGLSADLYHLEIQNR